MAENSSLIRTGRVQAMKSIYLLYAGLAVLSAGFVAASILAVVPLRPILAVVVQGYCAVPMVLVARRASCSRKAWLFLAAANAAWWLVDIFWAVMLVFFRTNPRDDLLMSMPFLIPNLMFCAAATILFRSQHKRYNHVQFFLDAVVTVGLGAMFLWLAFLQPNSRFFFDKPSLGSTTMLLLVVFDSYLLTCLFLFAVSTHVRKASPGMITLWGGVALFALADMSYRWEELARIRHLVRGPVNIAFFNTLFTVSVVLMFIGMIDTVSKRFNFPPPEAQVHENNRSNRKMIILLFTPAAIGLISGRTTVPAILATCVAVLLHQLFTVHVQNGIRNEHIFRLEKMYNEQLESGILDRTQKLTRANEELERLVQEDTVTNLFNRRFFMQKLEQMMSVNKPGQAILVSLIDVDQFRIINNTFGHEVGDEVLQEIAELIRSKAGVDALIARLGGDEFAVAIQKPFADLEDSLLSLDIHQAFDSGTSLSSRFGFAITVSSGITVFPFDGNDRRTIMRHADMALNHAKSLGLSRVVIFNEEIRSRMDRRNAVKLALTRADFDREFELYFQPQIQLADLSLVGAEALLRWHCPSLGMVSPGEFIPIAEENGLILPIGRWVTVQAIRMANEWNCQNSNLKIGINLSARQMIDRSFIQFFEEEIAKTATDPQCFDFEITEHSAMSSENMMNANFRRLSLTGASISIDDFGTGYSSLSLLRQLDVDRLKIAKPLIDNIAIDEEASMIVKAIIAMASSLGIRTIAEGVESQAQVSKLVELGCDEIQGYYFSRPIPCGLFAEKYLPKVSHAL